MPTRKKRPQEVKLASFPAPTGGWISNRNLAVPKGQNLAPGAAVLDDCFPTPTSVMLRRGYRRWASILNGTTIKSLFTYVIGSQREMFAATDSGIWNITTVPSANNWALATESDDYIAVDVAGEEIIGEDSLSDLNVHTGTTSGDWSVVQFTTAGGTFLIGVNGVDDGFLYDGTTFWPYIEGGVIRLPVSSVTGTFEAGETITGGTSGSTATVYQVEASYLLVTGASGDFTDTETVTGGTSGATATAGEQSVEVPGADGIATSDLSYVWAYKERIYFIEANSMNAWYLPVDSIGGDLTKLPLGGVFNRGGNLLWGHSWSLYNSDAGNLAEQCVFCTTEGEVAAYQGLSPEPDSGWQRVGLYRIGRPMGRKGLIKAGGDLVIATTVGFISLSSASENDYAALGRTAVSYPIEDEWVRAVQERGATDWRCQVWPDGQMVIVAPPTPDGQEPVLFVANSITGAWCRFTGWDVTALEVWQGRLFFGSSDGAVREGWQGGADEDSPYVGRILPLFEDLKIPGSRKIAKMARAVMRSAYPLQEAVAAKFDFDLTFPPAPDQPLAPEGNEWGTGIWDQSTWDSDRATLHSANWRAVGGSGQDASVAVQVTSGTVAPLDAELIRIDLTFTSAGLVS